MSNCLAPLVYFNFFLEAVFIFANTHIQILPYILFQHIYIHGNESNAAAPATVPAHTKTGIRQRANKWLDGQHGLSTFTIPKYRRKQKI